MASDNTTVVAVHAENNDVGLAPRPSNAGNHPGLAATASGEKERKMGHRRVDETGQVSYKKMPTNQLMGSIQLGIQYSIGAMSRCDERDLLMQDFMTVETVAFPKTGSSTTPAHSYSDFTFRTFAPLAFRYFLQLFSVKKDDFMVSLCNEPMRELSNPGASGSIFYLTNDDEFILKTVMHKEAEFLQKLLPGYYMNLNQNPHTLLPKFFGMYMYMYNQKNIRLTAMNNLLPSNVKMHLKFDLKGSTYKRKASKAERAKKSPTYKDLDFMEMFPEGLLLEPETYNALISTVRRDTRVLESFRIMDYSLLIGIHNLDQAARGEAEENGSSPAKSSAAAKSSAISRLAARRRMDDSSSAGKKRLMGAMEAIQAQSDPIDNVDHLPPGGIPARNHKGERLLLFLGIIDILQSYRVFKKLEHTFKSIIHDGDTVSVHRPGFYAHRFLDFCADRVFKKIPSPLKHSPSRRSKRESLKKLATVVATSSASAEEASGEEKDQQQQGQEQQHQRVDESQNGAEVQHATDYHMNPLPAHQVMQSGPPPDVVPGHVNRPKNRLHDAVKYGSREGSSDRVSSENTTPSHISAETDFTDSSRSVVTNFGQSSSTSTSATSEVVNHVTSIFVPGSDCVEFHTSASGGDTEVVTPAETVS